MSPPNHSARVPKFTPRSGSRCWHSRPLHRHLLACSVPIPAVTPQPLVPRQAMPPQGMGTVQGEMQELLL